MPTANRAYHAAMVEIRRSSAAQRHTNKARAAKRGLVKGGRPRSFHQEA